MHFALGWTSQYTFSAFIAFGFFLGLFALWRESLRDGFLLERTFDLYLVSLISGAFVSRLFYAWHAHFLPIPFIRHVFSFWTPGFEFDGFILGFFLAVVGFSYLKRWSLFRLLDIYSLVLSLGFVPVLVGLGLESSPSEAWAFYALAMLFLCVYLGLTFVRSTPLLSGFSFVVFVHILVLSHIFTQVFPETGLLFNLVLVTMGLLAFILRLKIYMPIKRSLPPKLLARLKRRLLLKHARLVRQEDTLMGNDPYLEDDRAVDNADVVDEVSLEDTRKTIMDAEKTLISKARADVSNALHKLHRGDYGICERCGKPIDPARLKAYPETRLCASCARHAE